MLRWLGRLVVVGIIGVIGYAAYDYYMAGLHTRPQMPDGAFSISYKNGMRAIIVGVPNEEENRRYLGFAMDVPYYVRDAWSFCHPPTEEEAPQVAQFLEERDMPGMRFEAVCKITVDEDVLVSGLITSVPRL